MGQKIIYEQKIFYDVCVLGVRYQVIEELKLKGPKEYCSEGYLFQHPPKEDPEDFIGPSSWETISSKYIVFYDVQIEKNIDPDTQSKKWQEEFLNANRTNYSETLPTPTEAYLFRVLKAAFKKRDERVKQVRKPA